LLVYTVRKFFLVYFVRMTYVFNNNKFFFLKDLFVFHFLCTIQKVYTVSTNMYTVYRYGIGLKK
jgi:hypothetical protein